MNSCPSYVDTVYYETKYDLQFRNRKEAIEHYIKVGKQKGYFPNREAEIYYCNVINFDPEYYKRKYCLTCNNKEAKKHWRFYGSKKGYYVNRCDEKGEHDKLLCKCRIKNKSADKSYNNDKETIEIPTKHNITQQSDRDDYIFSKEFNSDNESDIDNNTDPNNNTDNNSNNDDNISNDNDDNISDGNNEYDGNNNSDRDNGNEINNVDGDSTNNNGDNDGDNNNDNITEETEQYKNDELIVSKKTKNKKKYTNIAPIKISTKDRNVSALLDSKSMRNIMRLKQNKASGFIKENTTNPLDTLSKPKLSKLSKSFKSFDRTKINPRLPSLSINPDKECGGMEASSEIDLKSDVLLQCESDKKHIGCKINTNDSDEKVCGMQNDGSNSILSGNHDSGSTKSTRQLCLEIQSDEQSFDFDYVDHDYTLAMKENDKNGCSTSLINSVDSIKVKQTKEHTNSTNNAMQIKNKKEIISANNEIHCQKPIVCKTKKVIKENIIPNKKKKIFKAYDACADNSGGADETDETDRTDSTDDTCEICDSYDSDCDECKKLNLLSNNVLGTTKTQKERKDPIAEITNKKFDKNSDANNDSMSVSSNNSKNTITSVASTSFDPKDLKNRIEKDEERLYKIKRRMANSDNNSDEGTYERPDRYIFDKHMEIVYKNIINIKNYLNMCNIHLDTFLTLLKQAYQCLGDMCNPCSNYIVYNASRIKLCNMLREADNVVKTSHHNDMPIFYVRSKSSNKKKSGSKAYSHIKFPLMVSTDDSINNVLIKDAGYDNVYFKMQLMKVSLDDLKLEKYCLDPLNSGEKMTNSTSPIPPCSCPLGKIPDHSMYSDSNLVRNWNVNYHLKTFENALYKVTMTKEILSNYTKLVDIKEEMCLKIKLANLKSESDILSDPLSLP
jgi:hypothetical protein